jgi:hypothetical protein
LNSYRLCGRLVIFPVVAGIVAGALLLLTGCGALSAGSHSGPVIGVGNSSLNFGAVPIGGSKTMLDTITNNTTAAVTISEIQGSAAGFRVTGITAPLTLMAGQTASFNVQFKPSGTGDPATTISFVGPNAQAYASLSATATAVTPPTLSPSTSALAFGSTQVGTTHTSVVTLENSGTTDITVTQATMSGAGFSMSNIPVPLTISAGTSTSVPITFAPPSVGTFSGSVTLAVTANQVNGTAGFSFTGSGVVAGILLPTLSSVTFGSIQVGGKTSKSVTLTNNGGTPVTISQVIPSAAGFQVSGLTAQTTIAPNQSIVFNTTFAPTKTGTASGALSIVSDASNSPLSISLSGVALAAGALSPGPSSANFGNVTVGNNQTAPMTVTNTGGETVTLSSATVSGAGFTVTGLAAPVTLSTGQAAAFNVVFTPSAAGATSGALTINSNASNATLSIPLSGTGVALAQLGSNPASISFGNVQTGTSQSLNATLTNSGGTSLTILTATASGAGFSVSGLAPSLTLGAGQSTSFTILFSPTARGAASGSVNITSNGANPILSIPLSGTGATPGALTASPTNLAFSGTQVGNSTNLSETLTNTGGSTVAISQVNLTGASFSTSGLSNFPINLTSGQSVTFNVTFTPTSAGTASGSLSVASNAANSPGIALSGTGTASGTLAVSPTSLSFGNVTVGSNAALTGSLTASGASVTISSASSNNGEFVLSGISLPATLTAGQSANFTVTFTPGASGAASASLSLTSNASNSAAVQSALQMTGTGTTPIQHTVDLNWIASTSAVGYNIYRGTTPAGPYTMINTSLNSTTAYADNTVASGQTYYYVTTAVNASSVESGYSNQAQAVVPTP